MPNTNTLTAVLDRILAQALPVLRENCVMPRLVNSGYSAIAGGKGSTIEISVAGATSATAVTPSNTPPDIAGVTPSVVTMNLDKWYESGFFMTDKDALDIRDGVLPQQAASCVKSLANQVNSDLLALYKEVYGYAGAAGTTPFATGLDEAAQARKILATQLAPLADRRGVIDPNAEANFILVPSVLNANQRGDDQGIKEGRIARILGLDWFTDQAVPTHTAGTAAGATLDSTDYALGTKTVTLASAGTGSFLVGDIFTIAGDTQTYTVTAGDADVSGGGTLSFEPGLKVAITANNLALTLKASHVANLAFSKDAFGFANRPFIGGNMLPGVATVGVSYMQDPVSGLSLRVEHTREHKRDKLSFDILYGVKTVRPELAVRIAG
jgi:hypothetical protein